MFETGARRTKIIFTLRGHSPQHQFLFRSAKHTEYFWGSGSPQKNIFGIGLVQFLNQNSALLGQKQFGACATGFFNQKDTWDRGPRSTKNKLDASRPRPAAERSLATHLTWAQTIFHISGLSTISAHVALTLIPPRGQGPQKTSAHLYWHMPHAADDNSIFAGPTAITVHINGIFLGLGPSDKKSIWTRPGRVKAFVCPGLVGRQNKWGERARGATKKYLGTWGRWTNQVVGPGVGG